MTLIELKKCIESQNIPDEFIIFVCPENTFIANQYINAICDINNLTRTNINSLQEQNSALALVMEHTDELSVLTTDTFDEMLIDYSNLANTIVICNKVDKKIKSFVEDYIIEVPKLTDWQVKSYINLICPALTEEEVSWLYQATGGNVYRIVNEIDKVKLFPIAEQKTVLEELRFSPKSDLYTITAGDLAEAIIRNNKAVVLDFLRHEDFNIDFLYVVAIMLKTVKNIILCRTDSNRNATEIGVSEGQFKYYRYAWKDFPIQRLQVLLKFLSEVDLKLKSGLLDMSKNAQLDYLLINTII